MVTLTVTLNGTPQQTLHATQIEANNTLVELALTMDAYLDPAPGKPGIRSGYVFREVAIDAPIKMTRVIGSYEIKEIP